MGTCKIKAFRTKNLSFHLVWRIQHSLCQYSVREKYWMKWALRITFPLFSAMKVGKRNSCRNIPTVGVGNLLCFPSVFWTVKGNECFTFKWNTEFWGRYFPYLPMFFPLGWSSLTYCRPVFKFFVFRNPSPAAFFIFVSLAMVAVQSSSALQNNLPTRVMEKKVF